MTVPDETLARAAAEGDADAFSALLSRHYDRIFRIAFRLSGNRAEAEDVTQDVCLSLPAKIASYNEGARFTTWLYRVAVNAALDHRRRQASRMRAAEGWGEIEDARRAEAREAEAAQAWLDQAMRALPDTLRDTLVLVLDGLSHAEAGAVLDVSEGTISWRISEAKRRLRLLKEGGT